MMKKTYCTVFFVCIVVAGSSVACYAQRKAALTKVSAYSGPIIRKKDPSQGAKLSNLFNMKMHQSFSASIGTWGGYMTNTFAFTNTMRFFFTPKLTGQVAISLLTSPLSQLNFNGFQDDRKFRMALNARLKYQINRKMDIRVEFRKIPRRYGYPGSLYSPYRGMPFQYNPAFER